MKLMYEITVFPLISTLSLYLISNLFGEVLVRGQLLKESGAYFKVRYTSNQISKLCFCPFQQWKWNRKPQNQKEKKKENIKI